MGNVRKVDITCHEKGRIDISSRVCRCLSSCEGDLIDIYFDLETRELYLYVSKKASERKHPLAEYRNEVKQCKPNCKYMRVQCRYIAEFVNRLTHSRESRLFVGVPKVVPQLGKKALPLIYMNNQSKQQKTISSNE